MRVIEKRALEFGEYIFRTGQTVRQAAGVFGVSKSTLHFDVSHRLKHINFELYKSVKKVLDNNFAEKHLRGGLATKLAYEKGKILRQ